MNIKKSIKKIWNDINFWRLQFFVDLMIMAVLILIILYILGEYGHIQNELLKCMSLGD